MFRSVSYPPPPLNRVSINQKNRKGRRYQLCPRPDCLKKKGFNKDHTEGTNFFKICVGCLFRPDITVIVDWSLKPSCLCIMYSLFYVFVLILSDGLVDFVRFCFRMCLHIKVVSKRTFAFDGILIVLVSTCAVVRALKSKH